ncbi:MAG: hypothetical protein GWQ05_05695 [Verrucomicrobiaceae bacterium]|nr:hypothetical protein [Verrucomicrobiaceae bacterium]
MDSNRTSRRRFLQSVTTASAGALVLPRAEAASLPDYRGPNVVIVRFGGGVRRRETIDPEHTYAPYLCKELTKRGTLYPNMVLDSLESVETGHGQGTLYILTGKYAKYRDVHGEVLGERFEAEIPTVFEYVRKAYNIPEHQTLIINGEDRKQEEFYSFSNHHLFGVNYKSEVLSLFRYKIYLLQQQLAEGKWHGKKRAEKEKELREMEALDYRAKGKRDPANVVQAFWKKWRDYFGENGLVNARGDRLLTELSLWSLKYLRPKLMMVNYNDPDYVHWGNMSHYTRGISVIDDGLRQLVAATDADEHYRDNMVFVIVPDCGRDSNPLISVPCQHHFNSRSAHEIWALVMGPGIRKGVVVDKQVDQISIAATIGQCMNMETAYTEGPVLEDAIS